MIRGLFAKVVLFMVLLTISLMTVVGAFLRMEIQNFYLDEFYLQMRSMFMENREFVDALRVAADVDDGGVAIAERMKAYSGTLGINSAARHFYIFDESGVFLTGSNLDEGPRLPITPNITTALAGGSGSVRDTSALYMDVAFPIAGGDGGVYIVYIRDNKDMVRRQIDQILRFIVSALAIGLAITVIMSLLIAKLLVTPIQSLTRAAERVKNGDFSQRPRNEARDEIGTLTNTFNDMAVQLETTLVNLKKSEGMRREFVANVSHELRTPITSIRSYAETLEDARDLPPDIQSEFLRVIVNESDRMTAIVQDLLTLSRFDAGGFEFNIEWFSFEKSVRDVYNAMLLQAQRRNKEFTLEFEGEMPQIRGDRARVEQVLMNMISNALKYTHDDGTVEIKSGTGGGKVWARVKDDGIGIPKEDVSRVFERFYRVEKARDRESGGTGLGLSIAHEIVTRHDGVIELTSEQGVGTEITVILPIVGPKDE